MPYIKEELRRYLEKNPRPYGPGELNYMITELCIFYAGDYPNYRTYNEIIGALECCKMEFYRRSVVPYEDKKIKENGDVY